MKNRSGSDQDDYYDYEYYNEEKDDDSEPDNATSAQNQYYDEEYAEELVENIKTIKKQGVKIISTEEKKQV